MATGHASFRRIRLQLANETICPDIGCLYRQGIGPESGARRQLELQGDEGGPASGETRRALQFRCPHAITLPPALEPKGPPEQRQRVHAGGAQRMAFVQIDVARYVTAGPRRIAPCRIRLAG
jgi:hypothetical protein